MISLSATTQTALQQRAVSFRDLIWFTVRDRNTGAPFEIGYWSDLGTLTINVLNPFTGLSEARNFKGAGSLISIGAIPRVSNLTIQNVQVQLSQVADPNDLVRQYDASQAKVEIYRAMFTPGALVQLDAAIPRFVGFVDEIDIDTPEEGGEGAITLTLASHTQEMTKSNTATRSSTYTKNRNPADTFRDQAASVGTWELKWGRE